MHGSMNVKFKYSQYTRYRLLTHVISNETDAGATVVVPWRMGTLDVPSSALVHVAGSSHTETAKQGHSSNGMCGPDR